MAKQHRSISVGQRFGRLEVMGDGGHTPSRDDRLWQCKCDCGTEKPVRQSSLVRGASQSCGCLRREQTQARLRTHEPVVVGQRFDRWTVVAVPSYTHAECLCACGKTNTVRAWSLLKGISRSCGCINREISGARVKTHGLTASPEYRSWCGIKERCLNSNTKYYADYGGRGITVCDRWLNSFESFYADMGPRPSRSHSIDRIDNDGSYSPENCKWSTKSEQANNKRSTIRFEYQGRTLTVSEAAVISGLHPRTIRARVKAGWPGVHVMEHPVRRW